MSLHICDVYDGLWYFIFSWLGFSITFNGKVLRHIFQFDSLGGFSHNVQNSLKVLWLCVAWIIRKECNIHIFQRKEDNLHALCERVKLQSYCWFKSKYISFDFDYQLWRFNHMFCLTKVV